MEPEILRNISPLDYHLCEKCSPLFSHAGLDLPRFIDTTNEFYQLLGRYTKASIEEAARRNCELCQLFFFASKTESEKQWTALGPNDHLEVFAYGWDLSPQFGPTRDGRYSLRDAPKETATEISLRGLDRPFCRLPVVAQPNDCASRYVTRRPVESDPCNPIIYDKIRSLLDQCQDHHAQCRPRCTPNLPSRVLDVRPESGPSISLYSPTKPERYDYVALSYCWGGSQATTTTKETLNTYQHGIDENLLPKTIQDAIIVTRKLGFRYLWVDAFCIVQDSPEDKSRELAKMAQIYNSSTLTIAAASASAASEGFLKPWPKVSQGVKAPFQSPDGQMGEVEIFTKQRVDEGAEPLNSRAWTFQERYLSPRIIIYGQKEVLWLCQSNLHGPAPLVESLYSYVPDLIRVPWEFFQVEIPDAVKFLPMDGNEEMGLLNQSLSWKKIIEAYSPRKLTFVEDRLLALGALAEKYQELWRESSYVAGMWKHILLRNLVWFRRFQEETSLASSNEQYVAPSWSWASANGGVKVEVLDTVDAELIDCTTELVSKDLPFGSVKRGQVTINAALRSTCEAIKFKSTNWIFHMDDGSETLSEELKASTFLMLVGMGYTATGPVGLVLLPIKEGVYRRIGAFMLPKAKAISWSPKNPFRYTAREDVSTGKKTWLCQDGRKDIMIV